MATEVRTGQVTRCPEGGEASRGLAAALGLRPRALPRGAGPCLCADHVAPKVLRACAAVAIAVETGGTSAATADLWHAPQKAVRTECRMAYMA